MNENCANHVEKENNPIAYINMKNGAQIVVELCPELAPNTVNSFIYLAKLGIFDNYRIARLEPGYVVDISTNAFGREECRYIIANEATYAAEDKRLKPELGVMAMGGYGGNIAGGEFFFPLAWNSKLDGNYPCFGKVIQGVDEIERIGNGPAQSFRYSYNPNNPMHKPVNDEVIDTVRVDTFGVEYPKPNKLDVPLPPHWFMEDYDSLL